VKICPPDFLHLLFFLVIRSSALFSRLSSLRWEGISRGSRCCRGQCRRHRQQRTLQIRWQMISVQASSDRCCQGPGRSRHRKKYHNSHVELLLFREREREREGGREKRRCRRLAGQLTGLVERGKHVKALLGDRDAVHNVGEKSKNPASRGRSEGHRRSPFWCAI
jgi:hypothetical protein